MGIGDESMNYDTHVLRKRGVWTVPVVLGDCIPCSDRDDEEKEAWARMMMILFVPWRHSSDLKATSESWRAAFERRHNELSSKLIEIIANINVLTECRDVRDACQASRRSAALASIADGK
ncbi:hypothetical protein PYCCODRAFT_1445129 [Trametes coccinea BRFM310]|uniref:Uncharacterized protein n=1 Tax=Trametes coccinea (strain BRFM310) TaxID=1353009 RepID=A0A1Y2IMV9_TRAC3|nr:hypothetical protein PYCCODRAFT_1445129 [Trametes coccinea BRFM310]